MKTRINIVVSALALLIFSCQPENERMAEKIKDTESKLVNDSTKMMNRPLAEEQLKAYLDFTDKFPDDKRSEEFLYKAADLSNGMGKTSEALELYHRFCEKYPESAKAAYGLFLQAFIYENQLKNLDKAKELYTLFLSKYPTHELDKDAKFSLDNLGKSEDELIKMFEEKNKAENASAK